VVGLDTLNYSRIHVFVEEKDLIWFLLISFFSLVILAVIIVAIYDLLQVGDPILRNYPVVGHGRAILMELGPKLRQYIVADNNEERPFNRDQRHWIAASADQRNNYFGFGTDNDLERTPGHIIIKQSAFPIVEAVKGEAGYDPNYTIPCAKILGAYRNRKHAFRPPSVVGTSAMSFGSLSSVAVEAINRGVKLAGAMQNTGEGGISSHHDHGGGLIYQLGTGYFGSRYPDGRFHEEKFKEACEQFDVRAVEVKLSQGAKPGRGGVLPAKKITAEISKIRGIPQGQDCISPAAHREFSSPDELLDFVERLADISGRPVGIKSAVGEMNFWEDLIQQLQRDGGRSVDFITIDGGEGGTGAAPLTFSDHVSLPFKIGFSRVFKKFSEADLTDRIVFYGAGKLGFPQEALLAMAMGCDMISVGREAMLAIGCIQAQVCHTGKCPTGVATQDKWLMRGLDPTDKSARLANYITVLRKEILQLCHAIGVEHPALVTADSFEILRENFQSSKLVDALGLGGVATMPSGADCETITKLMKEKSAVK
jgi:glutamate synthase (ferredoxin)